MRVALADDSALFRSGLDRLLADLHVDVTASVPDGDALLAAVADMPPDVAVLDIRMPPTFTDEGMRTAETLRARHPRIGILILSTYAESASAARLLELGHGRLGYLLKDRVDDPRSLRSALDRLHAGECVIDPDLVTDLVDSTKAADGLSQLTPRELEVLRLMAEGRSNNGVSAELFLSAKTVEAHVSAIFTKLNLNIATDQNRRVLAVLSWLRARRHVDDPAR